MSVHKSWDVLEDHVRELASLKWRKPSAPEQIAGVNLDCVIHVEDDYYILIEVSKNETLEKVRNDCTNLILARTTLQSRQIASKCYFICLDDPTPSMRTTGKENRVSVLSYHEFESLILRYSDYQHVRLDKPFGSAVDPVTGEPDKTQFIPVRYESTTEVFSVDKIAELLSRGKRIVLLGEYGTGKSRCVKEVYEVLSGKSKECHLHALAINLRECWGMMSAEEIIRRHLDKIGLRSLADDFISVHDKKSTCYLLDGFDELGSQSWSDNPDRLKALRRTALSGVRDIISSAKGGVLISGRPHYFNGDEEMLSLLGLSPADLVVIRCHDEFSKEEMEAYVERINPDASVPDWLPRKPLICQFMASMPAEQINEAFLNSEGDATFCRSIISKICERESRIHVILDPMTVQMVMVQLSRAARTTQSPHGPLSIEQINSAFKEVAKYDPVDDSAVMLQRLPGLGLVRMGPESSDRMFVDDFLLDGLRGLDLATIATTRTWTSAGAEKWCHLANRLAHMVARKELEDAGQTRILGTVIQTCVSQTNKVLAADFIATALGCTGAEIQCGRSVLHGANFSHLSMQTKSARGLTISEAIIDVLDVDKSVDCGVNIDASIVRRVCGAAGPEGLPLWITNTTVDEWESVRTVKKIRELELSPPQKALLTIVRKLFFQKGAGRKEEALLRGLGSTVDGKVISRIVTYLSGNGIVKVVKGDEGNVYIPERQHTERMRTMLEEMKGSADPLWTYVASL